VRYKAPESLLPDFVHYAPRRVIYDQDEQTSVVRDTVDDARRRLDDPDDIFNWTIALGTILTDVQDPLRTDSIAAIVDACQKLQIKLDGYAVATGFGHGRKSFFTRSYSSARDYAAAPGGERTDGAMRAARGFLDLVTSPERLQAQQAHWRKVLSEHGPHHETEIVLSHLEDSSLVTELTWTVRES